MYKDRGIIKWAPFDALVGFNQEIAKMLYNKYKTDKPILLEDKLEDMNNILLEAYEKNEEVSIIYYEDGYQKTIYGKIKLIDKIKSLIHLENGFLISFTNTLNISM